MVVSHVVGRPLASEGVQAVMARTALVACLILELGLGPTHAAIVGTLDNAVLKAGVVRITASPPGETQKVGTGFIVRLEKDVAYIVTAAHVVSGDAQPKVQFYTQRDIPVQGTVRHSEGGDEVTGLAMLVVRGKDNLPPGLSALTMTSTMRLSGD
jgi:S1-C subfamily serine protease